MDMFRPSRHQPFLVKLSSNLSIVDGCMTTETLDHKPDRRRRLAWALHTIRTLDYSVATVTVLLSEF